MLLALLLVFILPNRKSGDSGDKNTEKVEPVEKIITGDKISDYIVLKNFPAEFKSINSSDLYYGFYYANGQEFSDTSCTIDISLNELNDAENELKKYQDMADHTDSLEKNGMLWNSITVKNNVTDPETGKSFPVQYHVFSSTIQKKVVIINMGYSGSNDGECFQYEDDILTAIHIVS